MWADRRWVTFKGKSKARRTYDVNDVVSVPDLAKRIKVTVAHTLGARARGRDLGIPPGGVSVEKRSGG